MKLKVSRVIRSENKTKTLVVFELKRGAVTADWKAGSERFQAELEEVGIATARGAFFPSGGKPFLDNLKLAFSNSSNIVVESV